MSYTSEVLADSPKGYWRLGEASGTNAADASGLSHPGTYIASPTLGVAGAIAGDADTAITLDGTTQYITVPNHADLILNDVFTLEAWVKPPAPSAGAKAIVSKQNTAYVMRLEANNKIELLKSHIASIVTSTAACITSAWNHVVCTKNGATVKQYLNGVDVTGTVTNATCADATQIVFIGADGNSGAPDSFFIGSLDEVAVYATALSAARVLAHYNAALASLLFVSWIQDDAA